MPIIFRIKFYILTLNKSTNQMYISCTAYKLVMKYQEINLEQTMCMICYIWFVLLFSNPNKIQIGYQDTPVHSNDMFSYHSPTGDITFLLALSSLPC